MRKHPEIPVFSHLTGLEIRSLSGLSVAQSVCALLTWGKTELEEPHYACFHFPALQCFQCQRVNASGVCQTGASVCQAEGYQQCFLRKVYKGRWVSAVPCATFVCHWVLGVGI